MTENNIEYSGFVTPCLILDRSDKADKGMIVDFYAKTEDKQPLICGSWSKGMDGLIHIYLMKPVPAMCDERFGWVAKQMLLEKPIAYMEGVDEEGRIQRPISKQTIPKKQVKYDPIAKQFRMM